MTATMIYINSLYNNKAPGQCTAPNREDSTKSPLMVVRYKLSNILASLFKWSQFCFKLNSFVAVEVNVLIYEKAGLLKSLKPMKKSARIRQ